MNSNKIILIVVVLVVFVFVMSAFKSGETNKSSDELKQDGCLDFSDRLPPYDSKQVEWASFDKRSDQLFGDKWKDYDFEGRGVVAAYVRGAFKAFNIAPRNEFLDIPEVKSAVVAYLMRADKFPHWEEGQGSLRCGV